MRCRNSIFLVAIDSISLLQLPFSVPLQGRPGCVKCRMHDGKLHSGVRKSQRRCSTGGVPPGRDRAGGRRATEGGPRMSCSCSLVGQYGRLGPAWLPTAVCKAATLLRRIVKRWRARRQVPPSPHDDAWTHQTPTPIAHCTRAPHPPRRCLLRSIAMTALLLPGGLCASCPSDIPVHRL